MTPRKVRPQLLEEVLGPVGDVLKREVTGIAQRALIAAVDVGLAEVQGRLGGMADRVGETRRKVRGAPAASPREAEIEVEVLDANAPVRPKPKRRYQRR
jgi:hypothetical protein